MGFAILGTKVRKGSQEEMRADLLTGLEVEKKSMSLPIVNGIDSDTDDETKRSPIAIARGLRSGLASATSFRKEAPLPGCVLRGTGTKRLKKPGLGFCVVEEGPVVRGRYFGSWTWFSRPILVLPCSLDLLLLHSSPPITLCLWVLWGNKRPSDAQHN